MKNSRQYLRREEDKYMKKILCVMMMFVCIVLCVALLEIGVYADDPCTVWLNDIKFSVTKDGTYYSTKDELLNNTSEATEVTEVYIQGV